jgi:hypothetical protein
MALRKDIENLHIEYLNVEEAPRLLVCDEEAVRL